MFHGIAGFSAVGLVHSRQEKSTVSVMKVTGEGYRCKRAGELSEQSRARQHRVHPWFAVQDK